MISAITTLRERLRLAASVNDAVANGERHPRRPPTIANCFRSNGKVLLCGNGGSAADCQHMAAELVGRLTHEKDRPGLPAIALTTDTSFLTAYPNDVGFDGVFARQVQALGSPGDILIAISTSGRSRND
jgi:D-sedoheptulose 7-phosphate isomerase